MSWEIRCRDTGLSVIQEVAGPPRGVAGPPPGCGMAGMLISRRSYRIDTKEIRNLETIAVIHGTALTLRNPI